MEMKKCPSFIDCYCDESGFVYHTKQHRKYKVQPIVLDGVSFYKMRIFDWRRYPACWAYHSVLGGNNYGIHRLVADAYYGAPEKGLEVRHLDGDPLNFHPVNLKYGTHAENNRDKILHGTQFNCETHPMAILTNEQAKEIAIKRMAGVSPSVLAKEYSASVSCIGFLCSGRTWGMVTKDILKFPLPKINSETIVRKKSVTKYSKLKPKIFRDFKFNRKIKTISEKYGINKYIVYSLRNQWKKTINHQTI